MLLYFGVYLLVINLLAFFMCRRDKRFTATGRRRIREQTLLLSACMGGAWGLHLSMKRYRHKTKHRKFTVWVPVLGFLWLAVTAFFCGWTFFVSLMHQ